MKNSVGAVMENQQLDRLHNEMDAGFMSIRDSIAETNKSLHERLDRTDERIDRTNERIDRTYERLDRTIERIEQIDEKVARTNERIDLINDKVDQTFSRLDENQQSLSARLITFEHKVNDGRAEPGDGGNGDERF